MERTSLFIGGKWRPSAGQATCGCVRTPRRSGSLIAAHRIEVGRPERAISLIDDRRGQCVLTGLFRATSGTLDPRRPMGGIDHLTCAGIASHLEGVVPGG